MKIEKKNLHRFVLAIFCLFIATYNHSCYANLEKYLFFETSGSCSLIIDKASVESNPEIIHEIADVLVSKKPYSINTLIIFGFRGCYDLLQPIWSIFLTNTTLFNIVIDGKNIAIDQNDTKAINVIGNNLNIFLLYLKIKPLLTQLNHVQTKILKNKKSSTDKKSVIHDIPSITRSEDYLLGEQEFLLNNQITELNIELMQLALESREQQFQQLHNSPTRDSSTGRVI